MARRGPRADDDTPVFHKIGEVRRNQGVTHRVLRKRLDERGFKLSTKEVQALDKPSTDVHLTLFYAIAESLEVPPGELVSFGDQGGMAPDVHYRACLVKAMKSALSALEMSGDDSPEGRSRLKLMMGRFIEQMLEADPDLANDATLGLLGEASGADPLASDPADEDD